VIIIGPHEFARRHLQPFKTKGDEIVPDLCPYCTGGSKKDKHTFALNVEKKTFCCLRGSCAKQGHFTQLCRDFGEEVDRDDSYEMYSRPRSTYKKPITKVVSPQKRVEDYLKLRGFSKEVWERRGVGEHNGNIALPYFQNSDLVLMKFRKPEKYNGQGQKAWREDGGKAILWGMDLCNAANPLVIVEGEMDALALDECGIENVVSVPSGAQDLTWIENCWDFLERFNQIIIWGDNDEPGQEMVRKLIVRLGAVKCYVVDCEYKDANESLAKEGTLKTAGYVFGAKPVPINGLIDLASVKPVDVTKLERVSSKIKGLDEETGGFLMGELSVWTGKSGQGKSTFLGQMLLESVEAGQSVCAYSGELRADRFQYWINLQAAGRKHIARYHDEVKNKEVIYVPKQTAERIKAWYRGKFWLYDNNIGGSNSEEAGIIKLFSYAARKYNCKVFLVDNLMTSKFDSGRSDSDFYRAQSNFVGELIHFAKVHNVHIHLVAHPRKTEGKLQKENVSGSGDITNRADNVFAVERVTDIAAGFNTKIVILKSRSEGVQDVEIGLMFDKNTKRFSQKSDLFSADRKYGWEDFYADVPIPGIG
jgi:twinkle protein